LPLVSVSTIVIETDCAEAAGNAGHGPTLPVHSPGLVGDRVSATVDEAPQTTATLLNPLSSLGVTDTTVLVRAKSPAQVPTLSNTVAGETNDDTSTGGCSMLMKIGTNVFPPLLVI